MTAVELKLLRNFLIKLKTKIKPAPDSLVFALGLINKELYISKEIPKSLAVIGPTQVGKSTVVNLLLGEDRAKVNALAAFTRKAEGLVDTKFFENVEDRLVDFFDIENKRDLYSIEPIINSNFPQSIVWDSADFDSVAAKSYKQSSLLLMALADVVVMVLSKEKYADLTVWQILNLLKLTAKPLLVLINKVSLENETELIEIIKTKFAKEQIKPDLVVSLPYLTNPDELANNPKLLELINKAGLSLFKDVTNNFTDIVRFFWDEWTKELKEELAARDMWQDMLKAQMLAAEQTYLNQYLNNTIYLETRQKTMLKLLELLEIPKLANVLGKIRSTLSWPMRNLMQNLKTASGNENDVQTEKAILEEVAETITARLQRQIAEVSAKNDNAAQNWWQGLWQVLAEEDDNIKQDFARAIEQYQLEFAPQVEKSAHNIYQKLQEEPATLNTLRAARASIDAAAILLALKTGGIGLNDVILAPALLSFSGFITESAIGHFIKKEEAKLKKLQIDYVKDMVFTQLGLKLENLPQKIAPDNIYAISASEFNKTHQLVYESGN